MGVKDNAGLVEVLIQNAVSIRCWSKSIEGRTTHVDEQMSRCAKIANDVDEQMSRCAKIANDVDEQMSRWAKIANDDVTLRSSNMHVEEKTNILKKTLTIHVVRNTKRVDEYDN